MTAGSSLVGRDVSLQQRDAIGRWLSVASYPLGAGSQISFSIPRRRGAFPYRIFMTAGQAGDGYADGWSGTQAVRGR